MTKSHTDATLITIARELRQMIDEARGKTKLRAVADREYPDRLSAYLGGIRFAAMFIEGGYIGKPPPQKPALVLAFDNTKRKNPGDVDAPPGQ